MQNKIIFVGEFFCIIIIIVNECLFFQSIGKRIGKIFYNKY